MKTVSKKLRGLLRSEKNFKELLRGLSLRNQCLDAFVQKKVRDISL